MTLVEFVGAPWSAEPRVPKKVSPCSLVQKCFRRAAKRRCSCQSVSGSWLTFCTTFGKRPSAIMLFMHALYLTFTSRVWRRRLTHSEPLVQKKPHRRIPSRNVPWPSASTASLPGSGEMRQAPALAASRFKLEQQAPRVQNSRHKTPSSP